MIIILLFLQLHKAHIMDTTDYQHGPLSMEQLHQAMQSSLDTRSLVHNFQIPLSPRPLSTLRLKTNQKTRPLNYELPSHLPKNLSMEMEHISVPSDVPQILRHNDLLAQNLDITLARNIMNEVELQNNLQIIQDHELARNMTGVNDLSQNLNRDIQHVLGNELGLSHLNRQNLETDVLDHEDSRKNSGIQTSIDNHILEQQMVLQKLEQNMPLRIDQSLDQLSQRIDQTLVQRMDHNLSQRLDQSLAQRLDQILPQRAFNPATLHEQKLEQNEMFSVTCQIKAEQEDDGYFYESMNQGIGGVGLTGKAFFFYSYL